MDDNLNYWKEIKRMLNQKCECGGVYLHKNKSAHEKTKKHNEYMFLIKMKMNCDLNGNVSGMSGNPRGLKIYSNSSKRTL